MSKAASALGEIVAKLEQLRQARQRGILATQSTQPEETNGRDAEAQRRSSKR